MFSRYEGRGSSLKGVDSIVSFQALKGSSGCLSIVLEAFPREPHKSRVASSQES